jgi:hypothetical protein
MACMICGCNSEPVHVHGHTQCGRCGSLQEGCCEGAGNVLECPPQPPTKETTPDDRTERVQDKDSEEHPNDDILRQWEPT